MTATINAKLDKAARKWRGDVSVAKAAKQLGIPKRTWEGMEQGRGFKYPDLLLLVFSLTECKKDTPGA
jgi:hypothetical protein